MMSSTMYKGDYLDLDTVFLGEKIEAGFKLIRDQLSANDTSGGVSTLRDSLVQSFSSFQRTVNSRSQDIVAEHSAATNELRMIAERLAKLEAKLTPDPIIKTPRKKKSDPPPAEAPAPVEEPQPVEAT